MAGEPNMAKRWPEKVDVFMSKEMKDTLLAWSERTKIPLAVAGRVAFEQFLEKYRDHAHMKDFP
jgi:hypothetical protein